MKRKQVEMWCLLIHIGEETQCILKPLSFIYIYMIQIKGKKPAMHLSRQGKEKVGGWVTFTFTY